MSTHTAHYSYSDLIRQEINAYRTPENVRPNALRASLENWSLVSSKDTTRMLEAIQGCIFFPSFPKLFQLRPFSKSETPKIIKVITDTYHSLGMHKKADRFTADLNNRREFLQVLGA